MYCITCCPVSCVPSANSVVPLVLLVIASVTNIVLDYVLIVYGHMGVGGAAYATIISQGLSGVTVSDLYY